MLEWLKTILGDKYTDEIDQKVSEEIGKGFVSRTDFNTKNDALKDTQGQLKTAQDGLKAFEGVDVDDLKGQIKKLQNDMTAQADAFKFDSLIDNAVRDAKARNPKAVKALLDMESLRESKDQTADIKAAIKALTESDNYLFDSGEATGTGVTASTGHELDGDDADSKEPKTMAEALQMELEPST